MALLDIFRRKKQKPVALLAPRQDVPEVVPLKAAHPDPEWEGDYPLWNWDGQAIQTAAIQHDLGNHVWSERLYEAMTREGRIYSALQRRGEGVRVFPFGFKYRQGTPERIEVYGEALREVWPEHVLSETERSEVVMRTLVMGFCPVRVHRPLIDGQRVPKLEVWTHRTLVWDYSVKGWRGQDDKGKVVIIPRDGSEEWIVFSLGGKRPWLKGALRPLARVLYEINQTNDLWTSNNEALGYAQKVLGVPNQVREQSEVQRAWQVVRLLRSGDVWLKPEGYSLELLETKRGDTHQNFKARLDVLWATVAIIILYHNLTQETKSGSLAATKSAMDLPREAAVTDARILEIGYRQAMRMWVAMNFSPANHDTPRPLSWYAPRPVFDTKEPEDKKELATTGAQNAASLKAYIESAKAANVDVETIGIDWREQARRCNVALLLGMGGSEEDGEEPEGDQPPVKYLDPPPEPKALLPGQRPPAVQKMAASSREPEQEDERLGQDCEQDSPMWTI